MALLRAAKAQITQNDSVSHLWNVRHISQLVRPAEEFFDNLDGVVLAARRRLARMAHPDGSQVNSHWCSPLAPQALEQAVPLRVACSALPQTVLTCASVIFTPCLAATSPTSKASMASPAINVRDLRSIKMFPRPGTARANVMREGWILAVAYLGASSDRRTRGPSSAGYALVIARPAAGGMTIWHQSQEVTHDKALDRSACAAGSRGR
jgi:hypothetical protein